MLERADDTAASPVHVLQTNKQTNKQESKKARSKKARKQTRYKFMSSNSTMDVIISTFIVPLVKKITFWVNITQNVAYSAV